MVNEELIRNTPTKVSNGYRVAFIDEGGEVIEISDYRSLSSALFHAGFDFSKSGLPVCRVYIIRKNAVTYVKYCFVQCYGKVY